MDGWMGGGVDGWRGTPNLAPQGFLSHFGGVFRGSVTL